jgi:hypothetical protein
MITRKHFAALIGFAFVAAWVGFNFGYAVLCLVGAALFYYVASFLEGELDLGELQARLGGTGRRSGMETATARTPRVQ